MVKIERNKKILWIRKLSCGHERPMNIAFTLKQYLKPIVGDKCFCRECCKDVIIDDVCAASEENIADLKRLINCIYK